MASVTQAQVNQAAEAIAARYQRVTVGNVRNELGGGSFTTLSPLVKAWKEQHAAETAAAEKLSDEARKAVENAARTIWSVAWADAAGYIERVKTDTDQRVKDAEAEKNEALGEVRRLEKTLADREADYLTLEKALAGARQSGSDYAATVQARETTIESLKAQLDEKRDEAQASNEKLDELHDQLSIEKSQAATEKSRADQLQHQLDTERQAHDETRKALDAQRSRADRAEERLSASHQTIETLKQERDLNRVEAKQALRAKKLLKARRNGQAKLAHDLEQERDELKQELDELKPRADRADRLERELEQMRAPVAGSAWPTQRPEDPIENQEYGQQLGHEKPI